MNVAIVFVTYNRLAYTIESIPRLLNDKDEFDLYIWDNASTDGTVEYLQKLADPRIKEIVFNKSNAGTTEALNYFWTKSEAELIGKVDNDCLMEPGWVGRLARAHEDVPGLGAIACWHYRKEDFDDAKVLKKIVHLGGHRIFAHPWVCGSGFLIKRKTFLSLGPIQTGKNVAMTDYFLKIALSGRINGWYYPLVMQVHMDDPLCEKRLIRDNTKLAEMYEVTYQLRAHNLRSIDDCLKRRQEDLNIILYSPGDAGYHTGWRPRLRRLLKKSRTGLQVLTGQ